MTQAEQLGLALIKARGKKGITRHHLSNSHGVSIDHLERVEWGQKTASLALLQIYADACVVSMSDFLLIKSSNKGDK